MMKTMTSRMLSMKSSSSVCSLYQMPPVTSLAGSVSNAMYMRRFLKAMDLTGLTSFAFSSFLRILLSAVSGSFVESFRLRTHSPLAPVLSMRLSTAVSSGDRPCSLLASSADTMRNTTVASWP